MKGSIRKRGEIYYYSFDLGKVNGKRRRVEYAGTTDKKITERLLREAIYKYEHSGEIINESEISVADFFDLWFTEHVMKLSFNTQQYYQSIIKNHIKPEIGDYKLRSINARVLQTLIDKKVSDNYSESSIKSFLSVLSKGFEKAHKYYKFIKTNPIKDLERPKFKRIKKSKDLKN